MDIRKLNVLLMKGKIKDERYYFLLKNKFNYTVISDTLEKISLKKKRHYNKIFGGLLPKEYNQLRKSEIIFGENLKQELLWNFAIIKMYVNELNEFVNRKADFEKKLILGNIDQSKIILDTIEKNICVSTWTLEHRFLIEEYGGGIESNKELFSKLSENNTDFVLTCLAEFFSFKAEINTSVKQYFNKLNEYFEKLKYADLFAFFSFKLAPISNYDTSDLLRIFTIEGCSSIVDRYITTIRICQIILMNKDGDQELQRIIHKQLRSLKIYISDPLIDNILSYYSPSSLELNTDSLIMYEIIEKYTRGNYQECLYKAEENLEQLANNFDIYPLMSKCCIYLGISDYRLGTNNNSIHYNLINYLINIYTGKENANDLINWLSKKAISMNFSSFCYKILKFINEEMELNAHYSINFLAHINSMFANPNFCDIYNNHNDKISYLDCYEQSIANRNFSNDTISLMRISEGIQEISVASYSDTEIDKIRTLRYFAKSQIKKGKYLESSSILFDILKNTLDKIKNENSLLYVFLKYRIQADLFKSYVSEDSTLESAMVLFVKCFIGNKLSTVKMNVVDLLNKLNQKDEFSKGNIAYPILLSIIHKTEYSEIYPACADFLEYYKVEKPSELIQNDEFDKELFIYFLKNVCTMEILDCLSAFEDAQEIFDERTNIIQNLLSIDADNEYEYVKEISQITQKIKVNSMVTMLDESRIDINVNGLKGDPESFYKENYKRYVSVSNIIRPFFGIDLDSLAKVQGYEDLERLNRVKRELNDLSTLNYSLFKEAIINIRNQFCFNTKYGLDASLSTRIRHGSLRNEMRSPFESNKLILSKEDADSQYIFPNEWLVMLKNTSCEFQQELRVAFERISETIDEKIEMLNQKWIRIRTEEKNPNGLFPFQLDENSISNIYVQFNGNSAIKDSEEFFDLIMLIMWELTDSGLNNIRKIIKEDIRGEFLGALDQLNDVLKSLPKDPLEKNIQRELENRIINCRLDVQHQLIKISEWFKVSESTDDGDYDVNLLLDTLIATCEMINPAYKEITLNREVKCTSLLLGITFTYLIDILRILYDNAVVHSEIRDYSNLNIDIVVLEDENFIKFIMKNNLAEHLMISNVKKNIESAKNKLRDSNYLSSYSTREGGSGYVKIINILNYKLQATSFAFYFDVNDERKYFVEIVISKQAIISLKKGEELHEPINS